MTRELERSITWPRWVRLETFGTPLVQSSHCSILLSSFISYLAMCQTARHIQQANPTECWSFTCFSLLSKFIYLSLGCSSSTSTTLCWPRASFLHQTCTAGRVYTSNACRRQWMYLGVNDIYMKSISHRKLATMLFFVGYFEQQCCFIWCLETM